MSTVYYKYSSERGDILVPCEIINKITTGYAVKFIDPFNNFVDIVYTDKKHLVFPKFSEYGGL